MGGSLYLFPVTYYHPFYIFGLSRQRRLSMLMGRRICLRSDLCEKSVPASRLQRALAEQISPPITTPAASWLSTALIRRSLPIN